MCVVVYKKSGIELPSKEDLKRCYDHNNDGAGYMFRYNNKIHIRKGFFDFELLYHDLKNRYDGYNLIDEDVVIHFRITSMGRDNIQNTHPFPVTTKNDMFNYRYLITEKGVAHNGTMSFLNPSNGESDTLVFSREYLPLLDYSNPKIRDIIRELTKSKFVVMDKYKTYLIGEFQEKEEILYSNLYHDSLKSVYNESWFKSSSVCTVQNNDPAFDEDLNYYENLEFTFFGFKYSLPELNDIWEKNLYHEEMSLKDRDVYNDLLWDGDILQTLMEYRDYIYQGYSL